MSETAASTQETAGPRSAGGTAGPTSLEAEVFSPRPNGPAAAALLAGAVGVFVLGLNTFVAAAGEGAKEWLTFQNRVGSLSGKTTMAGVVWLVVWALLSAVLWRRNVRLEWVWAAIAVLLIVGNLLMVPAIFERVEPGG